jgi:hypothetical protein
MIRIENRRGRMRQYLYTMTRNQCIRKSILAAAGLAMGENIHGFGLLIYHRPPKEIDTVKPAGMAELLYNELECRLASSGITDGQNEILNRIFENYFRVFTSLRQRTGQPHSDPCWLRPIISTLISMSRATSAPEGHPLYETAKKPQE